MEYSKLLLIWAYLHLWEWRRRFFAKMLHGESQQVMLGGNKSKPDTEDAKRTAAVIVGLIILFAAIGTMMPSNKGTGVPKFGEYLLYLFLSKSDREYLIGDLAEEYLEVRSKFGRRAANIWYYKQVITSLWPLSKKAVRWGLIAWVGEWVRRHM